MLTNPTINHHHRDLHMGSVNETRTILVIVVGFLWSTTIALCSVNNQVVVASKMERSLSTTPEKDIIQRMY